MLQMASTAEHHVVDITGGKINLHVFTGNVSMDIVANTHSESLPTMLTPFRTPQDNFQNITMDNSDRNFPTGEPNNSSNKSVLATQTPLTMISHSVLDESNDFQVGVTATTGDHIDESIEPAFTIPLLPWLTLSSIKPTDTVSLVFPELSTTTVLTNRTTSKPLSSAENIAPSHSENTSYVTFITEATKTERIGTSIDTPKVGETTTAPIILVNSSTVASSDTSSRLRTAYSSSSLLTTVTSSMLLGSPATMLSTIPLIPVKTLTSSRTTDIIISSMPVTSLPQSFISTSTTSSSSSVTEVVVSEKEYSNDENPEYVQTDFIEFSWDNIAESSIPITTTTTMIAITAHTGGFIAFNFEFWRI